MKKFLIQTISAAAFVLFISSTASAQLSLGVQGGLAKSDVENSKTIVGGGVNLRVFASPQFAVGVAGKLYADGSEYTLAGQNLETKGKLIPITGTVDYFFLDGAVRPYVGGDAGVYLSSYKAEFNNRTILESKTRSNFGAAPRLGVVFAFGNVGLQIEGIYHFVFGNQDRSANTGSANNIDFESTSKFGGVNVGLIFGLGGK